MGSNVIRNARYLAVGLVVVVIGRMAWDHRNDGWIQKLLLPDGPAKVDIRFDNGSIRDAAVILGQPLGVSSNHVVENTPGLLKKCVRGREVVYTDQLCPTGATV